MSLNSLLISVKSIKERTGLHANVDEKLIVPEIKTAQDMYILPLLGSELYKRLQQGADNCSLTPDEEKLLDEYVQDCLIYYVMSELPLGLSYQFYNKGLLRKGGENTEQPSMQDMIDVANRYKKRAEWYGQRLVEYLKENEELYPEYTTYGGGLDVIPPSSTSYSCQIWLGDDSCYDNLTQREKYTGKNGCKRI